MDCSNMPIHIQFSRKADATTFLHELIHYAYETLAVQLRDPKNDFVFNFNFDDRIKNL